jgi:hypothetical protein
MLEAAVSPIAPWVQFYTIIGPASATLTGLVFVVITLIAGPLGRRVTDNAPTGIATFTTPSVVHFSTVLAFAAILVAPWHVLWHAALLLGLTGLGGVAYSIVVARRMRRPTSYMPVLEDWLWHVVFPLAAYLALVVAAILLPDKPDATLFVIGASTVALLFIGIHNAWDTVTYLVVDGFQRQAEHSD